MARARAVAVDLDRALGDTRPLWDDWLASSERFLGIAVKTLSSDRGEAAEELDRRGGGNWRVLLERYCEERVAVYLRRDASMSAALDALASQGSEIGVFTDAPTPLVSVALAHLGAERRVDAVEAGSGALERLLARLGSEAAVVRSRAELLEQAAAYNRRHGAEGRR